MNILQLHEKIREVAKKEGLPFDENNIKLVCHGDRVYPFSLVSVKWDRAFSCFVLVFED